MTQDIFPEIKAAAEALHTRIAITESEIDQLKTSVASKRQLVRSWRKALAVFAPQSTKKKKGAERQSKTAEAS